MNCTINDDEFTGTKNYCQWTYDADDGDYDYGCGDSLSCEAFADDQCVYINEEFTYTDCYGVTQTDTLSAYLKCCTGDNCNHEIEPTTSGCSKNTVLENAYEDYYDCIYGSGSTYQKYACDESISEINCDGIYNFNKAQAECYCGFYSVAYNRLSDATKLKYQNYIDESLEDLFKEWNDLLGCDIELKCILATGVVTDNSAIIQYFIALVCAVLTLIFY